MAFLLQSAICFTPNGTMDTKKWLTCNNDKILSLGLKANGKTMKQLETDIASIKKWMKTQHHLPEISSDSHIRNFLIVNKFSIENTKQKLDMYYTIRHLMPEVYENTNMNSPHMRKVANYIYCFPLPKRTEEGYTITISKIKDIHNDNFDIFKFIAYALNGSEMRLQEDVVYEDIIIVDLEHFKLSQVLKFSPFHMKKLVTILEKVYSNKMRQFHFVNCPPFAFNSINFLKQLVKPKLAQRIFLYEHTDVLGEAIPLKILPRDYGGCELSLEELNQLWQQKLAEYKDRFDVLDKLKTNESLRPTPLLNDEILGYHGNFRKLEMD